jgi:dTDP-4-dehydrorhamnose 3,5-epimerase
MRIAELPIAGAYVVKAEPIHDERGYFARTWSREEFAEHRLETKLEQCSVAHNEQRGTVRGMHYQVAPNSETKVVTCIAGSVYDVLVDVRPDSPTYLRWHAEQLGAGSHVGLYVPKGVAHGYQTLTDRATLFYMISAPFHGPSARGVRWDDPRVGIRWPIPVTRISARDCAFPLLEG